MSNGRIMEEREEEMVSPRGIGGGGKKGATFRLAHFLTPAVTSGEVPTSTLSFTDLNFSYRNKEYLRVNFAGWKSPLADWDVWTDRMHSKYHSVWKKAGICDAVMNSTFKIPRNDDLIYGFVEKWCPETNTFMFPWGEATITLEDMMVLGGYSVLGDPVFSPIQSYESDEVEMKLLSARTELCQTPAKKAGQSGWLGKFMDSGSELEHEAFLALWLSRFVFPTKTRDDTIGKHVLATAIHLARGTKFALAPAVLASLYASLSEMKKAIVSSLKLQNRKRNKKVEILELSISAPFQLVQIWVWERFSSIRPEPLPSAIGMGRFAKWNNLRMKNTGDVKLAIDEAADIFLWRPYALGSKSLFPHRIFKEKARWIKFGSSLDEDQEILVRWLRVSELVGIDRIEQYLPHRVAMQFGFDQDVPSCVERANSSQILAWENYNREIRDERLYVPPCLSESAVTTRYLDWWKNGRSALSGDPVINNVLGVNAASKKSKKKRLLSSLLDKSPKKRQRISKLEKSTNQRKKSKSSSEKNLKDDAVDSSGFSPNSKHDNMPLSSLLEKSSYKRKGISKLEKSSNKRPKGAEHSKSSSERDTKDGVVVSSGISPKSEHDEITMSSLLGELPNGRKKVPKLEKSSDKMQEISKQLKGSSEMNLQDDAVVSSGSAPMSNGDGMPLSSLLENLRNKKKIPKLEKSSNKRQTISKPFESSSKKNLKNDAVVSTGFSPKSNHEGMTHSQGTDGEQQSELPMNPSSRKDKASDAIGLTGTDCEEANAIENGTNSMQKVAESENGSSISSNLEKGRAEGIVGTTVFLSASDNNLNDDNALVRSNSHNHEVMPHSEDTDAVEMEDKGSDMINLTGSQHEKAGLADQMRPDSKQKTEESEKGSSKTSDEADPETEADCNKDFNLNTINGRQCRLDAIEQISLQWDTRLRNLERIVAECKIKYAPAKHDKEVRLE